MECESGAHPRIPFKQMDTEPKWFEFLIILSQV
jgi:hypothetical protein